MADSWTASTTKAGFLGVTGNWVDVKDGKWTLRSEVIIFHGISGDHSGGTLRRYFLGMCERVGIVDKEMSKVRCMLIDATCLADRCTL
jgi:hypothetical protein